MIEELEIYKNMLRIREFENKVAELIENKEINCPCHLYSGQEAVAVGVCENLIDKDLVFSTHRSHGHYLAKDGDMNALMSELLGKSTGCSRGKGGSMHVCDKEHGLLGSSAIVGGTISIACGAALAMKLQHKNNVVVCFFGDGAVDEGVFYESLNFAKIQRLPILFVCENNFYSTHMDIKKHLAVDEICRIPKALNIENCAINGNDILDVQNISNYYINMVKNGRGPFFIECLTYRYRGHVGPNFDTDKGIRTKEELEYWIDKDPIKTFKEHLISSGNFTEEMLIRIKREVRNEVEESVRFARESKYPEKEELLKDVFKEVD